MATDQTSLLTVTNAPAIKILVIDGGGLRGYMTIQILKELEKAIRDESGNNELGIGQVFDMIVGTSTGGLIALGLGKKTKDKGRAMNCSEIEEMYKDVAVRVFKQNPVWEKIKDYASKIIKKHEKFDEEELKTIFTEKFGDDKMIEENGEKFRDWKEEPFISVIATMANNYLMPIPVLLRNYDVTGEGFNEFNRNLDDHLPGLSECKVWEAARATTAAPTYFQMQEIAIPDKLKNQIRKRNICDLMGFNIADDKKKETDLVDRIINDVNNDEEIENIIKYMEEYKEKEKINGKIDYNDFEKYVVDINTLQLKDGGVHSNSPCLFAYAEAIKLWPKHDIKMLSVGTSKGFERDIYVKLPQPGPIATVFEEMSRSKELATLMPLIIFAASKDGFELERWNPEHDPSRTDMDDPDLMNEWKDKGEQYAKKLKKDNKIQQWAKFLVQQQGNREKIVDDFKKTKRKIRCKL